ncbi:TolC family protein, partial [Escherichia coli]|nr:TolC family protein [Escherichia coli]
PQQAACAAGEASSEAAASKPTEDSDPDPRWWRSFGDSTLDALIARAAKGNLDLQEALLRIVEARTQVQSAAAQGLPDVRATGSYAREQLGVKGFLESQGVYNKVDQQGARFDDA